jgi:para-nitrobenzyl esterase
MAILNVATEYGLIEGLPGNNHLVSVFKGIPFAKPPVGELRWKAPQPPDAWDGTLEAYKFSNICTQPRFASEGGNTLAAKEFYVVEFPMSEDCLYLNVWTPAKSPDEKLPVGIYIHGGGFDTGYSYLNAYDGESFAKRGIVIVTIPYRLNIFGFLSHPELETEDPNQSTGNYGTMDQIAALEWIKRNIAAFGGDPENMTLFGQSAGGFSVRNLCASPLTKGNFRRAIMQSGGGVARGGLLDPMTKEEAMKIGIRFIEFTGFNNIEEARAADAELLIKKYSEFKDLNNGELLFSPSVDGYVLPEKPADYFQRGDHGDLEYMLGCTADEMRNNRAKAPPYDIQKKMAELRFGPFADEYLKIVKADDPEYSKRFFQNNFSDEILAGVLAWCENQLDLNRKPAFAYFFTYVPPGAEEVGAHHSVEHHYVFQTLTKSFRPYTGFDYDLSNELAGFWANFIKYGDPNGEGLPTWTPYTRENPKVLEIARERQMKPMVLSEQLEFIKNFSLNRL